MLASGAARRLQALPVIGVDRGAGFYCVIPELEKPVRIETRYSNNLHAYCRKFGLVTRIKPGTREVKTEKEYPMPMVSFRVFCLTKPSIAFPEAKVEAMRSSGWLPCGVHLLVQAARMLPSDMAGLRIVGLGSYLDTNDARYYPAIVLGRKYRVLGMIQAHRLRRERCLYMAWRSFEAP